MAARRREKKKEKVKDDEKINVESNKRKISPCTKNVNKKIIQNKTQVAKTREQEEDVSKGRENFCNGKMNLARKMIIKKENVKLSLIRFL